jgi:signal transduction histidine kinase/CheY-like chemotaxis protein
VASCAELIATRDWEATPIGPRSTWPVSLRTTVQNMLHTRQPMLLFWGADWTQFYNDAFVPSFGQGKHPAAMGQSARECWADAWPVVGAQLEAVARGEAAWHEDTLVPIFRNGRMEEVFWTYSYSPAHDDAGAIAGVLVIVTEMTGRVLAARRLAALAHLSLALSNATTHDGVFDAIFALAAGCPPDIPVVAVDAHGHRRATGELALDGTASGRCPLARPITIDVWPEPVTHAFVARHRAMTLTVGLSPRLPHEADYLGFLAQIAEQASGAVRRIEDAQEQARSDAERTAMLAALDEANRAKDGFLAMLGHELRNPLAPIVAALELMKTKDPTETTERAAIERQVHHVVRLVDDLLDVSRIAGGKLELNRAPTDVAEVIATAVDITRTLVAQRRHTLTLEIQPGLALDADPTRLVQVVSNLLVNAARYTLPGGTIRVEALRELDDVVIRVIDNGQGIPAELVPRIFDLFVQGKRPADRAQGGLGIGLAIVKNLVAAHGGSVAVASDGEGTGATFTVRLPAAKSTITAAAPRKSLVTTSRRRVLLVDDNEDAAFLLGDLVRGRGHDVVIAHHPDVALEAIRKFVPDLAVVDIGLPGLDGYELGKRILDQHPQCRIVALTGYGQASDRQRSADAGFFAHLVKPVRIDVFLELLG